MKKALVVLLALAFAGTVYAADAPKAAAAAPAAPALKITAYVNSGLRIINSAEVDAVTETATVREVKAAPEGTSFQSYPDDWGGTGSVMALGAVYTAAKSGVALKLLGTSLSSTSNAVTVDRAYGWVSPIAGLKLFAGKSYNDIYDGIDDKSADYFNSTGLSVHYSIAGLTVAAGIVQSATVSSYVNASPDGYVFGVNYALPKMFNFRLSAATVQTVDTTNAADEADDNKLDKLAASFSVIAVPGLTLNGGYFAENMSETNSATTVAFVEELDDAIDFTVGYAISPALSAKVVVYDFLTREYLNITTRVQYVVNPALTVYGQFAYLTEGKDKTTNYATMKPRVNATYVIDANSKFYGRYEYDTEWARSTVLLQYVYSY